MPTTVALSSDELLTTTRAVRRRLDLDRPVPLALVRECLEVALQAPSGSNAQGWHFVVVADAGKKERLAALYRKAFEAYRNSPVSAHRLAEGEGSEGAAQMERVVASADYLAEHLHRVPVLLIPAIQGRADQESGPTANRAQASLFGSILPAAWSFMLAARARGLGTAWTTLHLSYERQAAEVLGIPYEEVTQAALIPVAYYTGTSFKTALRKPLDDVLHVDSW